MGFQSADRKSRMALSEINITPFVDVMLVLLIMFMVTAPLMQQGIDVDLPKTSNTGLEVQEDPFILVIQQNGTLMAGKQNIPAAELKSKLQAIFSTRKNKQVYIQADQKVNYGVVAEIMGEVKAAGIEQIGLVTLPKQ